MDEDAFFSAMESDLDPELNIVAKALDFDWSSDNVSFFDQDDLQAVDRRAGMAIQDAMPISQIPPKAGISPMNGAEGTSLDMPVTMHSTASLGHAAASYNNDAMQLATPQPYKQSQFVHETNHVIVFNMDGPIIALVSLVCLALFIILAYALL